jgi:hypothetical protein
MEIKTRAIANPATLCHCSMVGLTLRISVWPREPNKMMVIKIDAGHFQWYLERAYAIKI